jgi:hypothetical protein
MTIMMKSRVLICTGLIAVFLSFCSQNSGRKGMSVSNDVVKQQADGTILLKLEDAVCYSDITNPSSNTAEWKLSISKTGRYKIWLTSATKDTVKLDYSGSVKVSLLDNQLEVVPVCDKVVQKSDEIRYPYFRADSYVGSIYFQKEGVFNLQVISDKVLSKELREQTAYLTDTTRLMSVVLVPLTR